MLRQNLTYAALLTVAVTVFPGPTLVDMQARGAAAAPATQQAPVLLEGRYSAESLLRIVPERERTGSNIEGPLTEM